MAILKDLIVNGDSKIIGNETAESFIKNGGTSSEFLKADGSVDSNTYATTDSLDDYLPLTGGTMTGDLTISSSKKLKVNDICNTSSEHVYEFNSSTGDQIYGSAAVNKLVLQPGTNVYRRTGNNDYLVYDEGNLTKSVITGLLGNEYLPLTGGQMTGPITFLAGNNKTIGLQMTIAGGGSVTNNLDLGWDWATGAGAGVALRSSTANPSSGGAGCFDIYARSSTATANTKHLIGSASGSLQWNGSEVITASKVDSALSSTSANPVKNSVIYTTIGGLDDLTHNEYNEIFDYPAIPNYTTVTKIYLDHLEHEVMVSDGYSSKVDWANYVHEEDDGCQSYVNSNSTFTYNNTTYQVWSCQEDPDDTFPLLLNPNTDNFQSLAEKSLYYGGKGNYTFITLDDNDTTYATNKKWLYDVRGE